ncbi:hypothetical protein AWC38_SpisGene18824, partial [Paramuricea clavata]
MDAKKARRNAKSSLTRRGNNLYSMIENNRPVEEITEALELVEIDYKTVVEKHEALVEKVDDEEFDGEEKWIEDCREKTLILKFRAKDYILKSKQEQVTQDTNKEVKSCAFKVEKPKLPKFSGDVRDYYSDRDAITILRASLQGKPLELIKGIGCDYKAAWEYLDSIYGDPRFIADTITQDISKFKALQDGEDARFCELIHLVNRSYNTLKEVGRPNDMNNNHMLALIEQKMSSDDRKVWARDLEREKKEATLENIMKWMTTEMKSRMRASAPLRNQEARIIKQLHAHEDASVQANPPSQVGVASVNNGKESMLPVIQAEVLGQEGKRRKANILLDSGAQVSLIRNSVAKDLKLKGKDADVTITKVGGEEEEIHTKLYKVSLLSLESNSVHHITAIGIPSISDNVASVDVGKVSEKLGLEGKKI